MHNCSVLDGISNNESVAFVVNVNVKPEIRREQEVVGAQSGKHARIALDASPDFPFYCLSPLSIFLLVNGTHRVLQPLKHKFVFLIEVQSLADSILVAGFKAGVVDVLEVE